MKVGILGSGDVAQSLGKGFVQLGNEVKLGTRNPGSEGLAAWKKAVGNRGSVGSSTDAAQFGEWLVLATHGVATAAAISNAGPKHFAGKIVLDVTNPLLFPTGGPPPTLAVGFSDSLGEANQRLLSDSRLVKVFNTVGHTHMFRPKFVGGPADMLYCGNDAGAKQEVGRLVKEFGWNPIDIGGIEGARLLEPMCVLWVTAALKLGTWDVAFKLVHRG